MLIIMHLKELSYDLSIIFYYQMIRMSLLLCSSLIGRDGIYSSVPQSDGNANGVLRCIPDFLILGALKLPADARRGHVQNYFYVVPRSYYLVLTRSLCRSHELLSRFHEIIIRSYELLSHPHEIIMSFARVIISFPRHIATF